MKLRKKLFLILSIASLSLSAQTENNYFEGSIEYRITYESFLDGITAEQLADLKGTKMIYTVRLGKTAKEYFNSLDVLIEKRVFLPEDCKNVQWISGKDSLFEFNPSKNNFRTLSSKVLPDTIIDGITLKGIELVLKDKREPAQTEVTYTYYFYDRLAVDPSWYSCYHDGDWGRLMNQMKSFCYWYKISTPGFYSAVFKSFRVNRGPVKEEVFRLPACSRTIYMD